MARDREIVCIHYIAAGECKLGKKAEFYGLCQHCSKYKAKRGMEPARKDNRKAKMEKIRKRENRYDY